jgi:hypothetical protein
MPSESALALTIVIGSAAAIGAVQFLPPLTAPGGAGPPAVVAQARRSQDFCQRSLTGVDCGCFAQKAAEVMAEDRPRAGGWSYADRWQLALAQGSAACR